MTCKAGICQVLPTPDAIVSVNIAQRYQTLVGFGASLAYAEGIIVGRDDKEALYDALFGELGTDTIRLGNHFEPGGQNEFDDAAVIIEAATMRLGARPTLLMSLASPPPELKANGSKLCRGNPDTCTLIQLEDGSFDYAGFAGFWRDSLDAYAAAGVFPDYVSIQNNPNWTPPEGSPADACNFLAQEGTITVGEEGSETSARIAGYVEAAEAVVARFDGLDQVPALFGPETTTLNAIPRYEPVFASGLLSAIAIHMYGVDLENPHTDELNAVRALATYYDLPVFQSEMIAEGLETAVFIHQATVEANASTYLQNDFIGGVDAEEPNRNALVQLEEEGFVRQSPYYAIQHFAARTNPGWVRVNALSTSDGLLASAWLAPDEDALTLILLNPGTDSLRIRLDLEPLRSTLALSEVTRTTFNEALEHSKLGPLAEDGWLDIPAQSAVTVALEQ